ncbi:hypothetical protein AT574_18220 [Phaeobacter inhibens]|nr:hypothetical protein AT574_18220 [Phaeobacter inhibens]
MRPATLRHAGVAGPRAGIGDDTRPIPQSSTQSRITLYSAGPGTTPSIRGRFAVSRIRAVAGLIGLRGFPLGDVDQLVLRISRKRLVQFGRDIAGLCVQELAGGVPHGNGLVQLVGGNGEGIDQHHILGAFIRLCRREAEAQRQGGDQGEQMFHDGSFLRGGF